MPHIWTGITTAWPASDQAASDHVVLLVDNRPEPVDKATNADADAHAVRLVSGWLPAVGRGDVMGRWVPKLYEDFVVTLGAPGR